MKSLSSDMSCGTRLPRVKMSDRPRGTTRHRLPVPSPVRPGLDQAADGKRRIHMSEPRQPHHESTLGPLMDPLLTKDDDGRSPPSRVCPTPIHSTVYEAPVSRQMMHPQNDASIVDTVGARPRSLALTSAVKGRSAGTTLPRYDARLKSDTQNLGRRL